MKKTNATTDKSAPYRTTSFTKITAPAKAKDEPRSSRISTGKDMRGK